MKYLIVCWPESQNYMEEKWFNEECHLINDEFGLEKYGPQAYFIPEERIK